MRVQSLDEKRHAVQVAEVLEQMAHNIRANRVPPWLLNNIQSSIAMCAHLITDYLGRQCGARPLPPAAR